VPEQCEFLLGSYSYIYSRPYSWAPLYIYTTNSYREINPAIAKKDFTDTDVKTLYEIFTDVELPRLTKQFSVARCVISRPGFDVSLARSFVSYQLTSTTLDLSEGICLESEGYDYIAMHLTCKDVPALFIGFVGTTHNVREREVVLCPGVRFEWDESHYILPRLMRDIENKTKIKAQKSTRGQYIGKRAAFIGIPSTGKRILFRNYIGTLMHNPSLDKFPIAARTKDLLTFFNYVNAVYQKHHLARVQSTVASFVSKAKAKIANPGTKDKELSIEFNALLEKIQRENLLGGSTETATLDAVGALFFRMEKSAKTIYMPWNFTMYERENQTDPKIFKAQMKPLKSASYRVYQFLQDEKARPSEPWIADRTHSVIDWRFPITPTGIATHKYIVLKNEGRAPSLA